MDRNEPDHVRGTGRTTDLALWYVLLALRSKGQMIEVHDHWPTQDAARRLLHLISDVLGVLHIEHRIYNMGWPSFVVIPQQKGFDGTKGR